MTSNEFFVRLFEPADQEEVRRLYRATVEYNPELYYRPLSGPQLPDDIAKNFSHPNDAFYVAVFGERIIGFCGIRTQADDRTVASFVNGTVVPEFRGRGAYRELYRVRQADSITRGIRTFLAITSHANVKMRDFLIKDGFREYVPASPISGFWHLKKVAT